MYYKMLKRILLITITVITGTLLAPAQDNITRENDNDDYNGDRSRIDRYLDVELWTNHSDDEFYEGDEIVINYRTNRDAFVTVYSIDTRGRVNLLFPTGPAEDNFVRGGATYSLPGSQDDFDLVVNGPEGVESIQIIASRDRFPVPDWYNHSGLVCDWDDRYDYMDYLNERFFVRYDGQRFAYDRVTIFVDEWEPDYYRPTYWPSYPNWSVCGNVYFDYPWGGTVYVNGIYWGCAPLYIPRLLVGWHTVTIYDPYGYCWESDFHVSRYNTVVFDHTIIQTKAHVISKYKNVTLGYKDPVKNGYPNYKTHIIPSSKTAVKNNVTVNKTAVNKTTANIDASQTLKKNYVRGSSRLVKSERGFETDNTYVKSKASQSRVSKSSGSIDTNDKTSQSSSPGSEVVKSRSSESSRSAVSSDKQTRSTGNTDNSLDSRTSKSGSSDSYYRKKSGSSQQKSERSTSTSRVKQSTQKQSTSKATQKKVDSPTKSTDKKSNQPSKSSSSSVSRSSSSQSSKASGAKTATSSKTSTSSSTSKGKEKR